MSVKKLPSHKEKTSKMKGEETKDIQATMEETVGGVTETMTLFSRREHVGRGEIHVSESSK